MTSLIISPNLPGSVGFIELKRDETSPVSDAQRSFAGLCLKLGVPFRTLRRAGRT